VLKRSVFVVLILVFAFAALPSFAAPVPSKTAANQSLASRDADLALVHDFVANEQVAQALAARGFTPDQVNDRVAQLNQQDLHQLAQNLNQLQAAGLTRSQWYWVAIGAVAAIILIAVL
jgi:TolA-binding protein